MKCRRNLLSGLIGLALLAAPIAAAARDNDSGKDNSHQSARATTARSEVREQSSTRAETHVVAPANMSMSESRERHDVRSYNRAPAVAARRDMREDRREDRVDARREWRNSRDGDDRWDHDRYNIHRDYDDRGYYPSYSGGAPYYAMPRGYAGGSCAWARHLRAVYLHDRNTGHPAAANDLIPQLHRAERNCGGVRYGYNSYRHYR
jgi:hypothetical protein